MALEIQSLVIDCKDPDALAQWWASALNYEITYQSPPDGTDERELVISQPGGGWELLFGGNPDEKVVKNRLHLDLRPDDRAAEVERLVGLGATNVDIGQGPEVTWVVLADPEGNEFCILRALTAEERQRDEWTQSETW
jgi:Glyoxalase-like domain